MVPAPLTASWPVSWCSALAGARRKRRTQRACMVAARSCHRPRLAERLRGGGVCVGRLVAGL